jgi:hypothetical protein
MRFLTTYLAVRQEDGSLPGEALPLFEGLLWFLVAPVAIFAVTWILVAVLEGSEKKDKPASKGDLLTTIE